MTATTAMFLTRHIQYPCLMVGVTRAPQLVAMDTISAELSQPQVLLWLRATPILLSHWGCLKEVLTVVILSILVVLGTTSMPLAIGAPTMHTGSDPVVEKSPAKQGSTTQVNNPVTPTKV